jgi:hypothetical protein
MKARQKMLYKSNSKIRLILITLSAFLFISCGGNSFGGKASSKKPIGSQAASNKKGTSGSPGGEDVDKENQNMDGSNQSYDQKGIAVEGIDGIDGSQESNSLAVKGKSLDLYTIFDVSGSLKQKTDPNCGRFAAFKQFILKLENHLNNGEDVRLSLVTFSDDVKDVLTLNNILGNISDAQWSNLQKIICSSVGSTNPRSGFEKTKDIFQQNMNSGLKEIKSILFFSDGLPTLKQGLPSLDQIFSSSDSLHEMVGSRFFGIWLGADQNTGETSGGLTPAQFMKRVVKNDQNLKTADSASNLADAFVGFIK